MQEKMVARQTLFTSDFVALHHDRVVLDNGIEAERVFVDHVGAAAVLPITPSGEAVLIKQYRYAAGKIVLEIPAGKLDQKHESIDACARREMQEETGFVANTIEKVADVYTSIGVSNERVHIYIAFDATFEQQNLDVGEYIEVVKVPLNKLIQDAYNGKLDDAKTMLAVMHAARLMAKKGL